MTHTIKDLVMREAAGYLHGRGIEPSIDFEGSEITFEIPEGGDEEARQEVLDGLRERLEALAEQIVR